MKIVRAISIIMVMLILGSTLLLGSCAMRPEGTEPIAMETKEEQSSDMTATLSDTEAIAGGAYDLGEGEEHNEYLVGEFLDTNGGTIRFNGFGEFSMENISGQLIDGTYSFVLYAEQTILTLSVGSVVTSYVYNLVPNEGNESGHGAFTLEDVTGNVIFFSPVCYE